MPLYRFHGELNANGEHAEESCRLGDDAAALRHARILLGTYVTVSVWRDARLLGRVSRSDRDGGEWRDV